MRPHLESNSQFHKVSDPGFEEAMLRFEGHGTPVVAITLVPTLKCNLRCSYCNIKEILVTHEGEVHPIDDLIVFVDSLRERGKRVRFHILGGEATSVPDRLKEVVDHPSLTDCGKSLTTNLLNLPDDWKEYFPKLEHIMVSIDGCPEDHDANRGKGTFLKTYKNLRMLTEVVDPRLITINTSVIVDKMMDVTYVARFKTLMACAGMNPETLSIGGILPGSDNPDNLEHIIAYGESAPILDMPCCAYRFMQAFTVSPDGRLWTNYYGYNNDDMCLGSLTDSMEDIRSRYIDCINNAHFIKDEKCVECPVLSNCWGLNCVAAFKYGDLKPSDFCNQEELIKKVAKAKAAQ